MLADLVGASSPSRRCSLTMMLVPLRRTLQRQWAGLACRLAARAVAPPRHRSDAGDQSEPHRGSEPGFRQAVVEGFSCR